MKKLIQKPNSLVGLTQYGIIAIGTGLVFGFLVNLASAGGEAPARTDAGAAVRYHDEVESILADHCSACHGNGSKKGGVVLDAFTSDDDLLSRRDLWNNVLKNVRAGLMPPADKPRPTADEIKTLETWIKRDAFRIDPADPDPGRVTLRRLNRIE